MSRIAILGDFGGDSLSFRQTLKSLGADCDQARLPHDLTVIQVGDLIRFSAAHLRGSLECLTLANAFLSNQADRWIQLLGNHELAALGGPRRESWPEPPDLGELSAALHQLWDSGHLFLAAALSQTNVLVTHAGLPLQSWDWLGSPGSACTTAQLLNDYRPTDPRDLSNGSALTSSTYQPSADVVWPEVVYEVYLPWVTHGSGPFDQIHGHASPWNWGMNTWWPGTPKAVTSVVAVDHETRRTSCTLRDGRQLTSVDWGLSLSDVQGKSWPVLQIDDAAKTTHSR